MRMFLFLVTALLLNSCTNHQKWWDISHFRIDDSILEDGAGVTLIYNSRGPDVDTREKLQENFDGPIDFVAPDYYIHIVAKTLDGNDTVNILTTTYTGINRSNADQIFYFYSKEDIITKLTMSDFKNARDSLSIGDLQERTHLKVARDPNYDYIADNEFPAVIGRLLRTK